MDYQFTRTTYGVVAKCSMEHEAFAHWLNSEITQEPSQLSLIFEQIANIRNAPHLNQECLIEGKEYSLYLTAEEVMVKANNLNELFDNVEIEDGFHFYEDESLAFCGLEDFEAFLNAYQNFAKTYH